MVSTGLSAVSAVPTGHCSLHQSPVVSAVSTCLHCPLQSPWYPVVSDVSTTLDPSLQWYLQFPPVSTGLYIFQCLYTNLQLCLSPVSTSLQWSLQFPPPSSGFCSFHQPPVVSAVSTSLQWSLEFPAASSGLCSFHQPLVVSAVSTSLQRSLQFPPASSGVGSFYQPPVVSRDKIWEWPGNEASLQFHVSTGLCSFQRCL